MYGINFSKQAQRDFKKLSRDIQCFINEKLKFYASQGDPLNWAKPLADLPPSTHRFRVRKYRIYFYLTDNAIHIEQIKLRGHAYRRK